MGSATKINRQSSAEDKGNLELIRGLSIVECKCNEIFGKSEDDLISEDQLRQHKIRDRVSESNISEVRDANQSTIINIRPG